MFALPHWKFLDPPCTCIINKEDGALCCPLLTTSKAITNAHNVHLQIKVYFYWDTSIEQYEIIFVFQYCEHLDNTSTFYRFLDNTDAPKLFQYLSILGHSSTPFPSVDIVLVFITQPHSAKSEFYVFNFYILPRSSFRILYTKYFRSPVYLCALFSEGELLSNLVYMQKPPWKYKIPYTFLPQKKTGPSD